jgi:nonspecific dipeptidase
MSSEQQGRTEFEDKFLKHVEENTPVYIDRLRDAVAIQSVSSDLDKHLKDINQMMDWTKAHIERLGGSASLMVNPCNTDKQSYPPILLGEFKAGDGSDKQAAQAKTVCVYGHLDVQPAAMEDGWDSPPFELVERDGKLYGRGSTDDKGPALSWLWVIEAFQNLGEPLPINIKLLYEGTSHWRY